MFSPFGPSFGKGPGLCFLMNGKADYTLNKQQRDKVKKKRKVRKSKNNIKKRKRKYKKRIKTKK